MDLVLNMNNNVMPHKKCPLKISVCIPTYNRAETIEETVTSVLFQEFEYFELLVCIDGGTDKTEELLLKYNDSRLKIIRNDTNIGYVPSMHKLTKLSSTNWIQFLSDDDVLDKQFLKYCWQVIEKRPDIGLVMAGSNFIDKEGNFIHQIKRKFIQKEDYCEDMADVIIFPPKEMLGTFTMMSIPMLNGKYNEILPISFPACIFNKKYLNAVGGSDVELYYGHDTLVCSCISSIAPCAYIDKPLFNFRIHLNSISNTMSTSIEGVKQYFLFIDKFIFFLQNKNIEIFEIENKLLCTFERNFFALNGRLLGIASKANNYAQQINLVKTNLKLFFEKMPQARYNIKNQFVILLAYLIPSKVIRKIGLVYLKNIKK